MPLSLYIHIPFCKEKCFYCDFLSFRGKDEFFEVYKNALISELDYYSKNLDYLNNDNNIINTIFIGGGTPSVVPIGYISDILEFVYNNFNIAQDIEITIESNPGTLSYDKIKNFKDSGINRISLGLQSYQNHLLKSIGRIHTIEQFLENYNNIRKVGFNNINIDLMFSLPKQTLFHFEETLNNIIDLNPEHISAYSLILEEDTKFFELYNDDKLVLASDDLDREFYYMAKNILSKNNYNLYEISNFSKPNKECKHNLVYWNRSSYLGVGLGASSYFNNFNNINNSNNINTSIRRKNTENFEKYINFDFNNINNLFTQDLLTQGLFTEEVLSLDDKYSEFVFLGLRRTSGINKLDFYKEFGVTFESIYKNQLDKFVKYGLLLEDNKDKNILKLSSKGVDLSNVVFSEFI